MSDERPVVEVHAEVPSSDDVRVFYEIPAVVADHIRAAAPDAAFVDAIVTVFEGIDEMRDMLAARLTPDAVERAAYNIFVGVARAPWTRRGDDEPCAVAPFTKNHARNIARAALKAALEYE